jgi:hypothetical protein
MPVEQRYVHFTFDHPGQVMAPHRSLPAFASSVVLGYQPVFTAPT